MNAPPEIHFGLPELGIFLLANFIVFAIIGGKLWDDVKRWTRKA